MIGYNLLFQTILFGFAFLEVLSYVKETDTDSLIVWVIVHTDYTRTKYKSTPNFPLAKLHILNYLVLMAERLYEDNPFEDLILQARLEQEDREAALIEVRKISDMFSQSISVRAFISRSAGRGKRREARQIIFIEDVGNNTIYNYDPNEPINNGLERLAESMFPKEDLAYGQEPTQVFIDRVEQEVREQIHDKI